MLKYVEAISYAYFGGSELIHSIKERRRVKKILQRVIKEENPRGKNLKEDHLIEKLEAVFKRGEVDIRKEYDRNFQRLGKVFANGDRTFRFQHYQ